MSTLGRSRNRRRPAAAQFTEADARTQLVVAARNYELAERRLQDSAPLRESVSELEQRLIDPGWQRFTALTEQEFTPAGRRQMRSVCRLMAVANPLLVRATQLRSAYIHGQGVQITARANGKGHDGEQNVQAVVSAFLTDEGNQRAYTGAAARDRLEHTLATDGAYFLTLFTRPLTGEVQVRVVLADEIDDIITNPEDRTEPWYYRRIWIEETLDPASGNKEQIQRERLYPAVNYRPATRPKRFGTVDVAWDAPMLHVDVNRPEHWQHGIPDLYSVINWARAYKVFLEQWASLVAALSKFAWRATADGAKQARQIRAAVTAAGPRYPGDGDPNAVGATAVTGVGHTLEAIPKSGATIDSESGRPLAMMVAAGVGLPVTMLLSDPGQTGARAVAETLDQPTELTMGQRRDLHTGVDQRICQYVIAEAVRAPQGPLKGKIKRDRFRDREVVTLDGDTDTTIDTVWPDLDDTSVKEAVDAIVSANETGTIPPEEILRLLLAALGVRNADTIIEAMVVDGEFQWPSKPAQQAPPAAGPSQPTDPDDSDTASDDGHGRPVSNRN
ncbi:hypothetical protein Drose_06260 [Dactylosporangium roseum]|uniref:Portal protein n=1 Tax=Dactylosporangium roseum TaxID=47989 RepID=A0ABY5ZA59_9ACTN|nr:hypothetical protein [Dactylosporangium roseum]UWZ37875.1 hypothetical protein Drose_06260 [Dactylosporangium roseum]